MKIGFLPQIYTCCTDCCIWARRSLLYHQFPVISNRWTLTKPHSPLPPHHSILRRHPQWFKRHEVSRRPAKVSGRPAFWQSLQMTFRFHSKNPITQTKAWLIVVRQQGYWWSWFKEEERNLGTQESTPTWASCHEETCSPCKNLMWNDTGTIWRAEKLDFQELDFKGKFLAAQENGPGLQELIERQNDIPNNARLHRHTCKRKISWESSSSVFSLSRVSHAFVTDCGWFDSPIYVTCHILPQERFDVSVDRVLISIKIQSSTASIGHCCRVVVVVVLSFRVVPFRRVARSQTIFLWLDLMNR
jgi:hypothetical protein